MRISWSRMRRGALGVTFALTCASSVQLSGCLKSSARGLTADLTESAGRAALDAEQQIAERKQSAAADPATTDSPEPDGRVELAGGAVDSSPGVALVQAEQKSRFENPLRKLLKRNTEKRLDGDPFLSPHHEDGSPTDTPAATDARQPDAFEQMAIERTRQHDRAERSRSEREQPARGEELDWEALLRSPADATVSRIVRDVVGGTPEQESGRRQTAPAAAGDERQEAANPFAALSVRERSQDPGESATQLSAPLVNLDAAPQAASASAGPADQWWPTDALDPQKITTTGTSASFPSDPVVAFAAGADSGSPTALPNPLETRRQRLRMEVLLSDCHTQLIRGELHAAYRSALLAEQIASEYQISVAAGQESPQQLVQKIADQIWKKSNLSPSAEPGGPPAPGNQGTEPERERPIAKKATEHDRTFARITPSPRWEPATPARQHAPLVLDFRNSEIADRSAALEGLPKIRPVHPAAETPANPPASEIPEFVAPPEFADSPRPDSADTGPRRFPQALAEVEFTGVEAPPAAVPLPAPRGVTFAIAESVEDSQAAAPSVTTDRNPAPFPSAEEGSNVKTPGMPAPLPTLDGPLLLAASPSPDRMRDAMTIVPESAAGGAPSPPPVEPAAPVTAGASPRRSLQWGVLGFIAAILSTILGLRLGRGLPKEPASAARPQKDEQHDDTPQLRIRRAA